MRAAFREAVAASREVLQPLAHVPEERRHQAARL